MSRNRRPTLNRYRSAISTLAVGIVLTLTAPSFAADTPQIVNLEVNSASDATKACEINDAEIQSAIRSAMRYNRVEEAGLTTPASTFLHVNVTTVQNGPLCISSYSVQFATIGIGKLQYRDKNIAGPLLLGEAGGVMSTDSTSLSHHLRVSQTLREAFDLALSRVAQYTRTAAF